VPESPSPGEAVDLRQALRDRYPRVAVTHEWLTHPGGSENVVQAILALVPHAEVFVSVRDAAQTWPAPLGDAMIHASWLSRLPGAARHYPKLLPLMDSAFRRFDMSGFDLIVSSNHACAKNVRTPPGTRHVCYCHTPMRYVWDPSFLDGENLGAIGSLAFKALLPRLRATDLRGAKQPDTFVANSRFVAQRIADAYAREAQVIHPPVDVDRFAAAPRAVAPDAPYLVFGRVVPYKKVDVAVRACARLGRPLVVAGAGRDLERVRALAGPRTTFLGAVGDTRMAELFATSRALLFAGEEDFGIVPVEAQAAGLPVVARDSGGARDSVIDGVTGVLYPGASVDALCAGIDRFETLTLDDGALREHAAGFAPDRFAAEFGRTLLQPPGGSGRDRS
jgi:glycosyltransferase involved in cell wall biosynthesis